MIHVMTPKSQAYNMHFKNRPCRRQSFVLAGMLYCAAILLHTKPAATNDAAEPTQCIAPVKSDNASFSFSSNWTAGECYILLVRNSTAAVNMTSVFFSSLNMMGGDYLVLYDGNASTAGRPEDIIANISGRGEPLQAVFLSSVSTIIVHISKNNSNSSFTAMVSFHGCQQVQNVVLGKSAVLLSPQYVPGRGSFQCMYNITLDQSSAEDSMLALSFIQFRLPGAMVNVTTDSTTKSLTGGVLPDDIYGSTFIQLGLAVNGSVNTSQSFSALATLISREYHQEKVLNGSASISFGVPELLPQLRDCRVTVTASHGKSIVLNITDLQLTHGDTLTVVDGASMNGLVLQSVQASDHQNSLVVSSGNKVLVRLLVDDFPGPRTVAVSITEQVEGGLYLEKSGNVSLDYPGSNTTQYYVLKTSAQLQMLQISATGKPDNASLSYTISIYDRCTDNLLVTFSPQHPPFPVSMSCTEALVEATWLQSHQNFTASFSSMTKGCNQTTSASQGSYTFSILPGLPPVCRLTIAPQTAGVIVVDLTSSSLKDNQTLTVYDGVMEYSSELARFSADNTEPGQILPALAVPSSSFADIVFADRTPGNISAAGVRVLYQVVDSVCGGAVQAHSGTLTSPQFPNQYPLNVNCTWTLPKTNGSSSVLFHFTNFSLAWSHFLEIKSEHGASYNYVLGREPGEDLLYKRAGSDDITFSSVSQKQKPENQVSQGFAMQFWILECGGNLTSKTGEFSTPDFPNSVNTSLCVWRVEVQPKDDTVVNIVNLTLTIQVTNNPPVSQVVQVLDGGSLHSPPLNISLTAGTASALSRRNTVMVVYNTSAMTSSSERLALKASYSTYGCDGAHQCDNGLCMHPGWRCNGQNDCGDGSDEKNCSGGEPSGLVHVYWVPICLIFGIVFGMVFAVCIPRLVRRYRHHAYSSFRDEPVIT